MTDKEMEIELNKYGFRFTNRNSGILKLSKIWNELSKLNNNINKSNNLIDFIRNNSKFYEDMLIFHPIPLAALYRELLDNNIKISLSKLKKLLDIQGISFIEES